MTESALSEFPALSAVTAFPAFFTLSDYSGAEGGQYQLHQLYQLPAFPTYYVEDPARRKVAYNAKGDLTDLQDRPDAAIEEPTPRARQVFGINLRQARRMKFLSQRQFAALAGVSRSYLGEVERGGHNICINRMEALALIMGLPLRELLDPDCHTLAGYRRRN